MVLILSVTKYERTAFKEHFQGFIEQLQISGLKFYCNHLIAPDKKLRYEWLLNDMIWSLEMKGSLFAQKERIYGSEGLILTVQN